MTVFGSYGAIRSLGTLKPTGTHDTWVLLSRQFEGRVPPKDVGQIIRVMQWNVLAQGLTASSPRKNYCKTQSAYLSWESRRYLLLLEILSYLPDVIILQELDRYEFLELKLKEFGYKGKFQERPFSPCMDMPDDECKPDGCAIFYHTERFNFVEIMHRQLLNDMQHSTSTLVLGMKLELVEDNTPVLVVNTHLKGGPKTEQNRYEACKDLLNFVHEHESQQEIVIIGADLCENPAERGYDHLVTKYKDAYCTGLDSQHPAFTTWRIRPLGEEKFVNDYLLYNDQQLRVLQVLDAPADAKVGDTRLPNNSCGSDHISLVCDFQRIIDINE